MSGIVYRIVDKSIVATYPTERGARIAVTRAKNQGTKIRGTLASECDVMDESTFYTKYDRFVTRKNLMTGKEYQESVYTPDYMSPSTETYWSM